MEIRAEEASGSNSGALFSFCFVSVKYHTRFLVKLKSFNPTHIPHGQKRRFRPSEEIQTLSQGQVSNYQGRVAITEYHH